MDNITHYGDQVFDKKYFGTYYKKYNEEEFTKAYRWFKGWTRLIGQLYPIKKFHGKKILVVGSGIGAFPKAVKEMGFEVQATDISKFIIKKAKKLQKDIDFKVDDIERIAGKQNQYNLIFMIKTLERLRDPKKALKHIKGRLKKDGMLIFFSPYLTKKNLTDPANINVKSPEEWIDIGKELSFKKMKFKYVSFLPFLYRYNSFFSRAFPIKINLPMVVNTCFFIFEN